MARKSLAALSVASLDTVSRRIKPPADLPEPCRRIWAELVDSLPPDRFHASDRPLLVLYCRTVAGPAARGSDASKPWEPQQ